MITAERVQVDVGAKVRIHIPQWMAMSENLASRSMEGVVEAASAKAIRFTGSAIVEEADYCHRCGRDIHNPVSRLAGYGPECSKRLGIPRDFTADQIAEIREAVRIETKITRWFPYSKTVIEVLEAAPPTAPGVEVGPLVKVIMLKPGTLGINAPFKYKDVCKSLGGRRWNPERKMWTVPATPASVQQIVQAFQRVGERVDFDTESAVLIEQAATIQDAAKHKSATDLPPIPITKTDAWLHQRQAFWFAKDLPAAMLAMDMGTGKSKVVVDLIVNCGDRLSLIVAPMTVVNGWANQFAVHAGAPVNVVLLKGSSRTRVKQLNQSLAEHHATGIPLVVVTNYEALAHNNGLGPWTDPKTGRITKPGLLDGTLWDRFVMDESHRVKAYDGQRSNICTRIAAVSKRKIALTGTPMPHSPMDIFGQYRSLDPGIFGTSFTQFRSRYAIMGGYGGYQVMGYQNEEELNRKVYSIAYRVTKDVLDLPPTVHVTRLVDMGSKARKVYQSIEKELLADLDSGATVTIDNVLVKLLRMQQVTSGHVGIDGGGSEQIDDAKERALADVIEDAGDQPIVVFTRFVHDLDAVKRVTESLGRRYAELSGRDKSGLNDKSQMAEGVDVLGVQMQSGGVGIDLTRAAMTVYYSVGFSLGDYEQSLARVHRPGQTRTTTYVHILAGGTIDERVYQLLADRKDVVEDILSHGLDVVRGAESIGLQSARGPRLRDLTMDQLAEAEDAAYEGASFDAYDDATGQDMERYSDRDVARIRQSAQRDLIAVRAEIERRNGAAPDDDRDEWM